jgi:hypothetical protein
VDPVTADALDLDALEALRAAATPGEWTVGAYVPELNSHYFGNVDPDVGGPVGEAHITDAEYITALHNADLIAALREAEAKLTAIRAQAEEWVGPHYTSDDSGAWGRAILRILDSTGETPT